MTDLDIALAKGDTGIFSRLLEEISMESIETFDNLMLGLFTCYWCGHVDDMSHIVDHVDNCLREINWMREHIEKPSGI